MVDVSIIAVSYNTEKLLPRFFDSVRRLIDENRELIFQIVVIDNASADNSRAILSNLIGEFPIPVQLLKSEINLGFGRANNVALQHCLGRYVLLLNTDAFVKEGSLSELLHYCDENPSVGVAGAKLVSEDGSLQPSCRRFPTPWRLFTTAVGIAHWFGKSSLLDDLTWPHDAIRECDWVPGCFYLVRRTSIDAVGLFDSRYFLYYEEVDHCKAVMGAGYKVIYHPAVTVIHLGGESAKSDGALNSKSKQLSALQIESEFLFMRKHYGLLGLALHICGQALVFALRMVKCWIREQPKATGTSATSQLYNELSLFRSGLRETRYGRIATR